MSARFAPLLALVIALVLPAAAGADAPVVPLLTGGEVHWVGSADREFHQRSTDDVGGHYDEDHQSDVSWDSRLLIPGNYADAPAVPLDGPIPPLAFKSVVGSGSSSIDELDCESPGSCSAPTHKNCTWTETANGPGAGPIDDPPGNRFFIESMGADIGWQSYTCADQYNVYNPSLFENCSIIGYFQADACSTILALPDQPLESDTFTEQLDHSAPDAQCGPDPDTPCPQTGHSTLTLACALCVTDVHYQQPDLPGRDWADVPGTGTFDGNKVRITATIHNAGAKDITAPVRFRDLTTHRDLPPAADGQQPGAQVTFPAGADTQVTFDWDTEGFAWYAPHNADPHHVAVLTPYGAARKDLPVRPKPVLLVHGWNADATTWASYPGFFKSVRDDWLAQAVTGMNTDPAHGFTLLQNAEILAQAIAKLRNEQDAEHVDLVGHSMGGLISRQYLQVAAPSDPDKRPVVAHLVMLGTPNMGSECAYWSLAMGNQGWPTKQLTPTYLIYQFDQGVTDTKGTKLSVLAGTTIGSFLTNFYCDLPKPNDLVVTPTSAFWTLTDIATQNNLAHIFMTGDRKAFDTFVKPHLAVTPSGSSARAIRAASPRATTRAAAPKQTISGLALAQQVKVPAHSRRRVALRVTGGKAIDVLLVAPAGVQAQLVDSRHKVAATTTSQGEFANLGATIKRRGRWTVALSNPGAAAAGVGLAAQIKADPFVVKPSLARHGNRLTLAVSAKGAGGRVRISALASALGKGGKGRKVRLRRHGGRYVASLKPVTGGTLVSVTVRGARGTRIAEASAP